MTKKDNGYPECHYYRCQATSCVRAAGRFFIIVIVHQQEEGIFLLFIRHFAIVIKVKQISHAPGVGKTFLAKRLAFSLIGEKATPQVEVVQFHQSYSYEDFIQGYKPIDNGFALKKGVFYNFCKKAQRHLERKYFFIIDEINRGNLKIGCFLLLSKQQSCERCRKSRENRDFPNCPGAKRRTLTLYQNKRPNMVAAKDLIEYARTHLPILLGTQVTMSRTRIPRPVHRIH